MNQVLKSRAEIDEATRWLQQNNYTEHPISCKNFELKLITEALMDGDLLDMGANGSFVLHNALKKNLEGRKVGIDLAVVEGDNKAEGAVYVQGDLMQTPFEDGEFDIVVSQSTIEHDVNLEAFAKECSRLLVTGGKLIVSFDYWPQRIDTSHVSLYGLKWNILNQADALYLIEVCELAGLYITSPIDWAVQDAVINPQYCSPANVSYTFCILEFKKA